MKRKVKNIHFVGIGGIGMSGIAEVLLNLGYVISGSDVKRSDITGRLENLGAKIKYGHDRTNLGDANVVVYSSAIKPDNPELEEAKERSIPVIPRAEMLAELMRMKYGIAVAGTHGKTTTTSLISTILHQAHYDPTFVIGGRLKSLDSTAKLGESEYLVVEADESDGSFLRLSPRVAVVTNIDPEHLDHFGNLEAIKDAFRDFLDKLPFYGLAILNIDDQNVLQIIPQIQKPQVTFGITSEANYRAKDIIYDRLKTKFKVFKGGKLLGQVCLPMPGLHMVYNGLAAIAVADEIGIGFETSSEALSGFGGIHRRFEMVGKSKGVSVYDDYGHHPTEIRLVLEAAKTSIGRRLITIFQPHRYTRTKTLYQDFLGAFDKSDILILTEIYPASEQPINGVTGHWLAEGIKGHGHKEVIFEPDLERIPDVVAGIAKDGDVVITLGAGDVWTVGEKVLGKL